MALFHSFVIQGTSLSLTLIFSEHARVECFQTKQTGTHTDHQVHQKSLQHFTGQWQDFHLANPCQRF